MTPPLDNELRSKSPMSKRKARSEGGEQSIKQSARETRKEGLKQYVAIRLVTESTQERLLKLPKELV